MAESEFATQSISHLHHFECCANTEKRHTFTLIFDVTTLLSDYCAKFIASLMDFDRENRFYQMLAEKGVYIENLYDICYDALILERKQYILVTFRAIII